MAQYWRDEEFRAFYWVQLHIGGDPPIAGLYTNPFNVNRLLVRNFRRDLDNDTPYQTCPEWVLKDRPAWIGYMANTEPLKKPSVHKPNPALLILCRLSGFDAEKIKSIMEVSK